MSNYEQAPATRLLNTHCAACGRPLVDAISVQHGMGPDCRKMYMVAATPEQEANRPAANVIVYDLALAISAVKGGDLDQVGRLAVADKLAELVDLGFRKLAEKLMEQWVQIKVDVLDGRLAVTMPYCERAVTAVRRIPGRKWDGQRKINTFPLSARRAVWNVLKAYFPGFAGISDKGAFVVPNAEAA